MTSIRQHRKRNKIYADVEVNITDNLELCCKTKSYIDMIPNRNKEDLKNTVQKSTMSKEELQGSCKLLLLLSGDPLAVYPKASSFLMMDTSISNNTSTPSYIQRNPETKCRIMIIL